MYALFLYQMTVQQCPVLHTRFAYLPVSSQYAWQDKSVLQSSLLPPPHITRTLVLSIYISPEGKKSRPPGRYLAACRTQGRQLVMQR